MWPCGATLIRHFLGTICRPARSGIHFQRLLDIRRFAFGRVAFSAVGVRDFVFVLPFLLSSFLFPFVLFGYVGGSPNSLLRSCMSGAWRPPLFG